MVDTPTNTSSTSHTRDGMRLSTYNAGLWVCGFNNMYNPNQHVDWDMWYVVENSKGQTIVIALIDGVRTWFRPYECYARRSNIPYK